MDAFSYTDIFDTKGIEYLIVIGFLLLIVPTWIWLNKPVKAKKLIPSTPRGINLSLLQIPHGVMFDKNHTWAFLERSGNARVGIDDLLLHLTGGVSVGMMKQKGEKISKGEVVATIEQDGKKLDIVSPISGTMQAANPQIESKLFHEDLFGKGWLYKIQPEKWKEETAGCMLAEEAESWTKSELERLKAFFVNTANQVRSSDLPPVVLQTGGELNAGLMADMSGEVWQKFQSEILD